MATKKKQESKGNVPATRNDSPLPAALVMQDQQSTNVTRPSFLRRENVFKKEAPTGFAPQIDFEDEVGRWTIAKFLGTRHGVGPNASEMYEFEVIDDKGKPIIANLWGSTILDTKMRQLDPQVGDWVYIQYRGTVPTNRGLNPAKDFFLGIVDEKVLEEAKKDMMKA